MSPKNPWILRKQRSRKASKQQFVHEGFEGLPTEEDLPTLDPPSSGETHAPAWTAMIVTPGRRYGNVPMKVKREEPNYTYTTGIPTTYKIQKLSFSELGKREIVANETGALAIKVGSRSKEKEAVYIEDPKEEDEYQKWVKRELARCIRDGLCEKDAQERHLGLLEEKT